MRGQRVICCGTVVWGMCGGHLGQRVGSRGHSVGLVGAAVTSVMHIGHLDGCIGHTVPLEVGHRVGESGRMVVLS
jgi:hypothetical protein